MPDLAIAALPALVTPVTTDDFAVEQTGVTKRITLDQIINDGSLAGSFLTLGLPLGGTAAAPTLLFGDDSGIWEETDDELSFGVAGLERFTLDVAAGFHGFLTLAPAILNEAASDTNPTLIPRRDSLTTGIGSSGADELSVIIGGVEHYRADATEHRFNVGNLVLNAVNLFSAVTVGSVGLSGGSTAALGGNLILFGEAHATRAGDISLRSSGTEKLAYDLSNTRWTFSEDVEIQGNVGFYNATPVVQATGYTTFTNLSTLRTGDADTLTVAQLADIVGTLIEDIKLTNLVGA